MSQSTENIIKDLEKEFGEEYVGLFSKIDEPRFISTGLISLDKITGGGIVRGMMTEVYGIHGCGKTSLCLNIVKEAQKDKLSVAYVDLEHSLQKKWAETIGVNNDEVIYISPLEGEQALDMIDNLIDKKIDLIVVDSVSAIIPKKELEDNFEDQNIGLHARLMSKAMRKFAGKVKKNNTTIIFINQLRDDIGGAAFFRKMITTGGKSLKYYAALRMKIARIKWIDKGGERVGGVIKMLTEKNKLFRHQLSTEVDFMFDKGFDVDGDLLSYLEKIGNIKKIGRTYYIDDKKIGVKDKAIEYIKTNNIAIDN